MQAARCLTGANVAFTVTFPTSGPAPQPQDVAGWLTEQGEAFEREGPTTLRCKALPLRLVADSDAGWLQGYIELERATPITRLVDLLFELSLRTQGDVRLAGVGAVSRPELWLALAEDQARLRLARALERSLERSNAHEIHQRLWGVVGALKPGRDVRWDARRACIVEVLEVDAPDGISVEDAAWHAEDPAPGDGVGVPLTGQVHMLAWAWLSDAFPGLAED